LSDSAIRSWRDSLRVYTQPRVLSMFFLGFSAGLPLLLVSSNTLSAWLHDVGITLTVIGFFSWVGIIYSIKFFWAPVIDRLPLPLLTQWLGRRRSWMLLAQVGIAAGLFSMTLIDPAIHTGLLATFAVLVAFSSATQDIVIDAWRIEAVESTLQGAMAATYVGGYRTALLVAGAGALLLADIIDWNTSYRVMALMMLVGIVTTLIIQEPEPGIEDKTREMEAELEKELGLDPQNGILQRLMTWFSDAVIAPFVDFFRRYSRHALIILALVAVYKLSDVTMGVMAMPFYLDMGYSKTEIASIAKIFGFGMTLAGVAVGGLLVARFGLLRPLLAGAVLIAATNLLFATLALSTPSLTLLTVVISADNLSGGIATAVFIAYLSSLTNAAYTATQYALFSSLMSLPGHFIGGIAGIIVDHHGYFYFFVYAALLGLPAIGLVIWLIRLSRSSENLTDIKSESEEVN